MTATAYHAILADLARDLEESEAEELELRRLERYLLRKLDSNGAGDEAVDNGVPASRRSREQHLDLLDAVRHDLASVERVLDDLRLLDTRVRRLSARPSGNGASAVGSAREVLQVELDEPEAAGDSRTKEPAPVPPADEAGETDLTTVRMRPCEVSPSETTSPTERSPASTSAASRSTGSAGLTQMLLEKSAALRIVSRGNFASASDHKEPVDVTVFTAPEAVAGATASLFVLCRGAGSGTGAGEPPAVAAADRSGHSRGSFGTMLSCDGRLSFELSVASIPIRMPRREIVWTGIPNVAEFRIPVPAETRADSVIGKLTVVQNTVPIGRVAFQWRVVRDAEEGGEEGVEEEVEPSGQALRFERVYLCHATQDRPEVQRRVPLLKSAGIRPVEGNLELDASQRWARGLYRQIDGCDALLLFWSAAAADSAWIQKEWQYGLKRHGADFILPVVLDGCLPPQLSGLHAPCGEPYLHLARR